MTLQLHVQNPWFHEIKYGRKTIEGRTGEEGSRDSMLGRPVIISNGDQAFTVTVAKVVHFKTLSEYIDACGWNNVAPHAGSRENAIRAYREVKNERGEYVFSDEKISSKGGINALFLE